MLNVFAAIPLILLMCECGTKSDPREFPFYAEQKLIIYNTEGQGEDKVVCVMIHIRVQALKGAAV